MVTIETINKVVDDMSRIKYFNEETQKWEYADTCIGEKYKLTEEDKTEIVQSVLSKLPTYDGGVE